MDADEFGDAMRDWNIELKQLQPGGFSAAITVLPLGPALVCAGRYNQSLLQHVGPPDDCLSINRPGRGSDPVSIHGRDVQDGEVFVSGSGAECESMNRGVLFPTALSIKLSFLQSQTHWLQDSPLLSTKGITLRSPGVKWTGNFLDAMEWLVCAVAQYPDVVHREDVCGSMLDLLLSRIDTLGVANSPLSEDRETRSARRLAVNRAREYILQNLTEPIRLSDLCKYAKTQARSLEYGFHEVVGLSPIAYIRTTRLHRVRRLLRSTAVRTRSISEIALDCGFWHLSQFAVDYKRLFAESPSVTYRRTHAELPRIERRGASSATSHAVISKLGRSGAQTAAAC
jgi:AraC family ethanolamine operon transcriptional activator